MKNLFMFLILPVLFAACSSSTETTNNDEKKSGEEVYIFDEIPADTTLNFPEPIKYPSIDQTYYVVQIGAFTTKQRAEKFAEDSRGKISEKINIAYSDAVNLFVVQIGKLFTSRYEAEKLRNQLWQTGDFNDAWILTVNK
ncbi:MAG: hypothetical protein Kow0098_21040 [Ignavibacteriaceae bacterium]